MEACFETKGRRHKETQDILTTNPFLDDYIKIIQSKGFRRLAYKAQVFSLPDNPHVRTRLVHTNEVIAISSTIAEILDLNSHLCMAIAAGHDIGHTPYGHIGERLLSQLGGRELKHHVNSVVVAQHIERKSDGLNLTYETLDGILNHSRGDGRLTVENNKPQEHSVVMFADKIAYTFSDLNDAIRYNHLKTNQIPDCALRLGKDQRERTKKVIYALVEESREKSYVQFSEGKVFEEFNELRGFMYKEVYNKRDWELQKVILKKAYQFFSDHKDYFGINPALLSSLLTDQEANKFGEILLKSREPSIDQIMEFGIFEIIHHIKDKEIDYTIPDLKWDVFYK